MGTGGSYCDVTLFDVNRKKIPQTLQRKSKGRSVTEKTLMGQHKNISERSRNAMPCIKDLGFQFKDRGPRVLCITTSYLKVLRQQIFPSQ